MNVKLKEMFNEIAPKCEHELDDLFRAIMYAEGGDFNTCIFILTFRFPCDTCNPLKKAIIAKIKEKVDHEAT